MTEPGFQVAPVTESDMNIVRDIFDRMARNIVNAAGVTDTLETMKAQIVTLERYVEEYRNRNRELDEQVASVRRERDDAIRRLDEYKADNEAGHLNVQALSSENANLRRDLEQSNEANTNLRRERDDYVQHNLELEDRLNQAKEWIRQVTGLFNNPPQL